MFLFRTFFQMILGGTYDSPIVRCTDTLMFVLHVRLLIGKSIDIETGTLVGLIDIVRHDW